MNRFSACAVQNLSFSLAVIVRILSKLGREIEHRPKMGETDKSELTKIVASSPGSRLLK